MKYEGEYINEISFPLGGIGSGSIGLGGDGRLIDWEIFNRPSKGSLNGYSHIAVKAVNKNGSVAKILNGDMKKELMGRYGSEPFCGYGFGPVFSTLCGMPHFKNVCFNGEYPIATVTFQDDSFPGAVTLTAWNPFIPLDDKNSSIPGAFFDISIENDSEDIVEYTVAFSVANPYPVSKNVPLSNGSMTGIKLVYHGEDEQSEQYGDITIATDSDDADVQLYWYRGGWNDNIVAFWNEFANNEKLLSREYEDAGSMDHCTLYVRIKLMKTERRSARFVLTWNNPNCINYWDPYRDSNGKDIIWKNYYATVFKNSVDSAEYALSKWDELYDKTLLFKDTLYTATLDEAVIDAISANLSILKSPTVIRLQDGSFYGWEGVQQKEGSCEGTCQHVWNYAYALCFLFPRLERTIRDAEIKYAMLPNGKTSFRLKIPYGRGLSTERACLDGQMGIILKIYREWKISGDTPWLEARWEQVKKILEYAWNPENPDKWDMNKDGVLEGCQHHTLDKVLFGPSGWLEGIYLAALKAAHEIAKFLGDDAKSEEYISVFNKGYDFVKNHLFNGSYFIHKADIKDKTLLELYPGVEEYWNEEVEEVKYQICDGSSIEQLLGQWHASILGLGRIFDSTQAEYALQSMLKLNYKSELRTYTNLWRNLAMPYEGGTIVCEYPKDAAKPYMPVMYNGETMPGMEYQFAGVLASHGMIDEAIKVIRTVRNRFDGRKRNPWNEFECGSNYARSMSSFALLPIFSGFVFNMQSSCMGFRPIIKSENFKCPWSLSTGWGSFEIRGNIIELTLFDGYVDLCKFIIPEGTNVKQLLIDNRECGFSCSNGIVEFNAAHIKSTIKIIGGKNI